MLRGTKQAAHPKGEKQSHQKFPFLCDKGCLLCFTEVTNSSKFKNMCWVPSHLSTERSCSCLGKISRSLFFQHWCHAFAKTHLTRDALWDRQRMQNLNPQWSVWRHLHLPDLSKAQSGSGIVILGEQYQRDFCCRFATDLGCKLPFTQAQAFGELKTTLWRKGVE